MLTGPESYAIFLFLATFPALWVARASWQKRNTVAGRWLAVAVVGMAGWSVFWALMILFERRQLTLASANLVLLSVNIASISWFLLTVEYTRRKRSPNRYVLALLLLPLATQVVAWTNPVHGLLWGPSTIITSNGVVLPDEATWFIVHAVYSSILTVVSLVLLLRNFYRVDGIYRTQTAILLVGGLIPFTTSMLFTAGIVPTEYLNPTPVAFIAGASVFGWGLYRYKLFEIVPIARRTAYDVMDEAVITLDERDAIADINRAAREMFDLQAQPIGMALTDALGSYPEVIEEYQRETQSETISIKTGDSYRYLTLDRKAITSSEATIGSVLVFKDVTRLKRHENELDLLKQVFGRVFRHDLSNELNVIRARGELLASESTGAESEHARAVVEKCDDILATSQKAKAIETVVEADRRRHDIDISVVVENAAQWCRERYPNATVEVDVPNGVLIRGDSKTDLAIQGLLENGIIHNDSPEPTVWITATSDRETVTISIEDDGPGIDAEEAQVLETREIDQLNHSSGLGLWLIHWVVKNSGGTVHIENTSTGARAELTFDRSADSSSAST